MIRKDIPEKLLKHGILPKYKGFNYLNEILLMLDKDRNLNLTKAYLYLAKKYGVSPDNIYHNIRYSIVNMDYSYLIEFDSILKEDESFPTNKNFIFYILNVDLNIKIF